MLANQLCPGTVLLGTTYYLYVSFGFIRVTCHLGSSSLAHLVHMSHFSLFIWVPVHLFSLSNMKKTSIFLQFSSGNLVTGLSFILALCQWGKFTRGRIVKWKMLYKTNIRLAKLVSSGNLKSGYAFFIFDLKCYFRSSNLHKAM